MTQAQDAPGRSRAAVARDLEEARAELARFGASLDRYEKAIEVPRLLEEIRRLELELQLIDEA